MEIFYIKKYDPQFNFTEGGDGMSGFKHSEKSKRKISEALKGKNHPMYGKSPSEEARKKISETLKGENNPMYGKSHSEEARKKMSENHYDVSGANHPMYGKSHAEEARKKMSEALKGENHPMYGKSHSEETRKKMSEAHNTTGFYRVCKNKNNSCKQGFIWCYRYYLDSKYKAITSIDLKKLEEKVRKEGLEWKIIDEENSIKSIQENNNRFN